MTEQQWSLVVIISLGIVLILGGMRLQNVSRKRGWRTEIVLATFMTIPVLLLLMGVLVYYGFPASPKGFLIIAVVVGVILWYPAKWSIENALYQLEKHEKRLAEKKQERNE